MFSLSDEISKFEKFYYSKELDQMIPLDDRLLSEGLTIKDLVAENSFIIGEIRKIKDAFVNYCKLNDKVYKKIIQHELNVNTLSTRITSTSLSMDRKVQETSNYLKTLHQSMIRQNQRTQNMFEENYSPLRSEVQNKVQRQVLPPIVRALIEQYDNQSSDKNSNPDGDGHHSKKRKKISTEELAIFKTQIQEYFQSLDMKIEQVKLQLGKQTQNLTKNINVTNNANKQIEWLVNEYEESVAVLNKKDQQLKEYINEKTAEQVWTTKLQQFNKQFVINPFNKLNIKIDKLREQTKDQQKNVLSKILLLGGQLHIVQLKIKQIDQQKLNAIHERIASNAQTTQTNFQKIDQHHSNFQKKVKSDFEKKQNKLDSFWNELLLKQHKLNKKIDSVASQISGEVLKGILLKIDQDMKQISNQITQFRKKLALDEQKISLINEELSHTKQIMCKKANFTDMVYISDKKANRQEIQLLQDKFSSSKQIFTQYNSLKLRSSSNNSNSIFLNQQNSKKGKKALKISRRGITKASERIENQTAVNLFMCGLEQYESPNRRFSTNPRYKTNSQIRPTTAHTTQQI